MNLNQIILSIDAEDMSWYELGMKKAKQRFAKIAKPLNSLGRLEECIHCISGIQAMREKKVLQTINLNRRIVTVFCADNGIVQEHVTQTGSEVTAIVAKNMLNHKASINMICDIAKADVLPVDAGMQEEIDGMQTIKVERGTKNFYREPAMTPFQAEQIMIAGFELSFKLVQEGYCLLATGEMGIGNTSTSSAIASVLLEQPVEAMTGPGAGLSKEGLVHKTAIIRKSLEQYNLKRNDPMRILCCVGGFDIAAMVGFYLGAAYWHVPVVMDGFISTVAALLTIEFCKGVSNYLIASHVSKEPAASAVLAALKKKPLLSCDMCLGEGTGAAAVFPLLDMAQQLYTYMPTFEEISVKEYRPL